MISFDDALIITASQPVKLVTERVELSESLNRVLAENIVSDTDMPPFNKSAMDGYACRFSDLSNRLEVISTIKAGDIPNVSVRENQCVKIMTGGKVPEGAECVVMVEHTKADGDGFIRVAKEKSDINIAFKGEDLQKGEVALEHGILIKPQHIAVLASVGAVKPLVYKRPVVSVLTTGDEILEPEQEISGTSIRNSNGPQLVAQIASMGAIPLYMGVVPDSEEEVKKAVERAAGLSDMVILTGGVSMGEYDFVPGVLKKNGVELYFEKVAVKPGRPTLFGRDKKCFYFGLPGNPVSSFTIFELLVKPLIYSMMGHDYEQLFVRGRMSLEWSRMKADRVAWIPVNINEEGDINVLEYHGSAHIHALKEATGLLRVGEGVFKLNRGELADVRQI